MTSFTGPTGQTLELTMLNRTSASHGRFKPLRQSVWCVRVWTSWFANAFRNSAKAHLLFPYESRGDEPRDSQQAPECRYAVPQATGRIHFTRLRGQVRHLRQEGCSHSRSE